MFITHYKNTHESTEVASFMNRSFNTRVQKYSNKLTTQKDRDQLIPPTTPLIANQSSYIHSQALEDERIVYEQFNIPKASGGYRTINAPGPFLKNAQKALMYLMRDTAKMIEHDAAFAYVKHRSTTDALIRHQENESNWFLKLDIKDFFPSVTEQFIRSTLPTIYPFHQEPPHVLNTIVRLAMLNGGLPQGSPLSPYLTNILMIPFDHRMTNQLFNFERHHYIYTRYADDIFISCKEKFDPAKIINLVQTELTANTPFVLNLEKTKFRSRAGRNFHLGIILNQQNDISVGHRKKEGLRAIVHNLLRDYTAYEIDADFYDIWPLNEVQQVIGKVSYATHVAPEFQGVIRKLETKTGVTLKQCHDRAELLSLNG